MNSVHTRMMVLVTVVSIPVLMAAYPEKYSDSIEAYGGYGTYRRSAGCGTVFGRYYEGGLDYKHNFNEQHAIKINAGYVGSRVTDVHNSGSSTITENIGDQTDLFTLNPMYSFSLNKHFGLDAGFLLVYSLQDGMNNMNTVWDLKKVISLGPGIYPSLGLRSGDMNKAYFSVRALNGDHMMTTNYMLAFDVTVSAIEFMDIVVGASGSPYAGFIPANPYLTLNFKIHPIFDLSFTGKYNIAQEFSLAGGFKFMF